ncbi:hypothetical protein HGRIS_005616 [Hohenbuehelia grisea]|uniref:F-box domain-containing protein n=1 Tax=Hohenbuehelia grisea TaxID=104357 RepID=A0ABR3JXN5_9AGAR
MSTMSTKRDEIQRQYTNLCLKRRKLLDDLEGVTREMVSAARRLNESAAFEALPIEILVMIFKLAASSPPARVVHCRPEIALSLVSKRWRDVAISIPSLWQTIPYGMIPIPLIHLYSERSNPTCLHAHFTFSDVYRSSDCSLLWEAIKADASRWRELTIVIRTNAHAMAASRLLEDVYKQHSNVALTSVSILNEHGVLAGNNLCRGLHSIIDDTKGESTTLRLQNIVPRSWDDYVFSTVHTLHLRGTELGFEFSSALNEAPQLERLFIDALKLVSSFEPVSIPGLRELCIKSSAWPGYLPSLFDVPNLESLTLLDMKYTVLIHAIPATFTFPKLTSITMSSRNTPKRTHFLKLLDAFDAVTSCTLIGPTSFPLFEALERGLEPLDAFRRDTLFPNLKHVSMWPTNPSQAAEDALVDLARSRKEKLGIRLKVTCDTKWLSSISALSKEVESIDHIDCQSSLTDGPSWIHSQSKYS